MKNLFKRLQEKIAKAYYGFFLLVAMNPFISLVKKHYGFLIKEYGFSIVYVNGPLLFDNYILVMQKGECKIRFMWDRGVVIIEGALRDTNNYDGNWYGLLEIISYLTKGPKQINYEYGGDWIKNKKTTQEIQLVKLKGYLEPYWNQIIELFQEKNFINEKSNIDKFTKELSEVYTKRKIEENKEKLE
jgi:hypothetical protein